MLETPSWKLVGRQTELASLIGLLDAAASGRPVVTLISGDAGVGKTRLVTEVAGQARELGFTVLSGRCAELGVAIPYLPLADALRDATTGASPGTALLQALEARPVLTTLLPDRTDRQPAGGDVPGLVQQQLFGAVLGLLSELAQATPVLLILEDLHWADRSTRDLVTFLSRVLHSERLAVVATYRSDDMHRAHPLRAVVTELLRLPNVGSVQLGPLSSAAMAEHLVQIFGQVDATELDAVITRAEGNAYYAEELMAAAATGSALPSGLADLLLARMESLSPAARRVLRAAAVTGRLVDDDLVRETSGLDDSEYEHALREAVANQLLVPHGAHGYAFRHALLREAVYTDLLPGERTRLHARLAELLSDERRLAEMTGTAAELAHHCLASHDIPGAFAASILAGREAERLAAPAEAHQHYDQALSLWDRVPDAEKVGGMDRGKLALRSALSAADGGDTTRAVAQLRRLLSFLGDGEHPTLRSRANERLAFFLLDLDQTDEALTASEAAVDALPPDPPRWQYALALATHGRALLSQRDLEPARARALQAQQAGAAAGARWVETDALVTLGLISERTGNVDEAIDLLTRAHKQALGAQVLGVELRAYFHLARIQLEQGDLAAAGATAHEGTARAERAGLGLAPYGFDLRYLHYLAHYADGAWDHAEAIADGFAVRVTSIAEARLSAMALFIAVARGSGRVGERGRWLEPMLRRDQFAEYLTRGLLAEHALWQGDQATAVAMVRETIHAWESADDGSHGPPLIRIAAIGLCAIADQAARARAAGDTDRAAQLVKSADEMLAIARESATLPLWPGFALGIEGNGWLARAEAEWSRAAGRNDPGLWEVAVGKFAPAFVYEAARSRWRLAEALAEAGDREAAREQWQLATEVAAALGALPLRSVLADLGRRARLGALSTSPGSISGVGLAAGLRPGIVPSPGLGDLDDDGSGTGGAGRTTLGGLTEREIEVLRLLAAGASNREIGAELFISPKTASVHVSNILAKLGAASRTEAAAIAHRAGIGAAAPSGG